MNENLTQILDWLLTKWEVVLIYFGGLSGLIAFLVTFIKVICPLITSIINKKSGVNASLKILKEQNKTLELKLNEVESNIVKSFIHELDERESKKKQIYYKLIQNKDEIKQEIDEIIEKNAQNKLEIIEKVEDNQEIINKTSEILDKEDNSSNKITKVVIINE